MPSYETELSLVDQMNPNMPLPVCFTFETEDTDKAIAALRAGIERTARQLPFLSGKIYEDAEDQHKMKISWSDDDPKIRFEEVPGPDLPSYAELAAKGVPLHTMDFNPMPPALLAAFASNTKPVFLTAYTKLKGGLLVMFATHHSLVDGTGRSMIMGLVAQNTRDPTFTGGKISSQEPLHRAARLAEILRKAPKDLVTVEEKRANSAPKPKEGAAPPAQEPATSSECKMLFLSVQRLEAVRRALQPHTQGAFSLNTMITSILWGLTSAARSSRLELAAAAAIAAAAKTSDSAEKVIHQHHTELSINVNSRPYFERETLLEKGGWLGNLGTYTPWRPWADLHFFDESDSLTLQVDGLPSANVHTGETGLPASVTVSVPRAVPTLIERTGAALARLSLASVAADFAAANDRVNEAAAQAQAQAAASSSPTNGAAAAAAGLDRRLLRDGNLAAAFNGLNFTVTYWNSLDLLPDFGPQVGGRPTFMRMPRLGGTIDGMAVPMPRHRTADVGEAALDRFDVILMLRPEDMAAVLKSPLLQALYYAPPV